MSLDSTSSIIEERLLVWEALADFFLDTELDDSDYERIANVLASSPYSIQDAEDILRHELYPVLIRNLRSVAGEWAGFDREWLRGSIKPRLNKRPKFRLPLLQWSMVRDHWLRVSELIRRNRKTMANKDVALNL